MNPLEAQIDTLATLAGSETGAISRLIRHFASLPRHSAIECERLLMEMKVLALLRQNFVSHADMPSVNLTRFPEVTGIRVSRGVFSPEFATDSYLWAKLLVERDIAVGKSVLEMGAGSGIISFMLHVLSPPDFLCAVDINPLAVENLRANAAYFGIDGARFLAVESDVMESLPRHLRFDTALWAMPWILRVDPEIQKILLETQDPVELALLRSAIDPGGESIKRFVSQVKPFLHPNGKVLLITADFIQNDIILAQARDEGYSVEKTTFARGVTVVEHPEISLDLCQIELTRP